MPIFILKFNDFILNRRTVSGSNALDLSAIQRRPAHVAPDDGMDFFIRMRDVAANFGLQSLGRAEREWGGLSISMLRLENREIDGSTV